METMTLMQLHRAEVSAPAPDEVRHDETEMLRAAARGDTDAFEQLVHRYHRRVLNFLYQMTRQRQDAEDLTQHTFVKAFQHIHRIDCDRPIINWLLTIARH